MQNVVVHIVLPRGFALVNGQTLKEDTSLLVVGELSPWYASVDQVRLEGGVYLTKAPDIAIAAQIWQASKNADALTARLPPEPTSLDNPRPDDLTYHRWFLFYHARNNFVALRAALDTLLNVFDLAGARGSKTLANFSVTRMSFARDESMPKKTKDMEDELKKWRIVIQSGGEVGFGGHAKAGFAAKGIYDPSDAPAGRLWYTTGMGANKKTVAGWGAVGKPIKYGSPTFVNWRVGRNFGNYVSIFPKVVYS
jgi:hypothetical protein